MKRAYFFCTGTKKKALFNQLEKWICHTNEIFSKLNIAKLEDLIKIQEAAMAFQASTHDLPSAIEKLINFEERTTNTRAGDSLIIKTKCPKTIKQGKQVIQRIAKAWNSLEEDQKIKLSTKSFKRSLSKKLVEGYKSNPICATTNCPSCV